MDSDLSSLPNPPPQVHADEESDNESEAAGALHHLDLRYFTLSNFVGRRRRRRRSTRRRLPDRVATAAAEGDLAVVRRWLEGNSRRDVNAEDRRGSTLLLHACTGPKHDDRYDSRDDEAYVDLVRYLISQGADVNYVSWCSEKTAMSVACYRGVCAEIVAELLSAGASPHVGEGSMTPLGVCLAMCERPQGPRADVVTLLLRAGAELNSYSYNSAMSVEDVIHGIEQSEREDPHFHPPWNADNKTLKTIKELIAGVRREGSWLAFRRAEQKASFRLWWLVARERATTADPLLGRVAGLPNELRSSVLGFWCLAE